MPRPEPAPGLAPPRWARVSLSVAAGLAVTTAGYVTARDGRQTLALWLFWVGVVVLFLPGAAALLARSTRRGDRITIVALLSEGLFGAYFFRNPAFFDHFDELLHQTTLWNVVAHERIFHGNSLLPISPYFPGLELLTAGLHWCFGLPMLAAEVLAVVLARLLLVVAIFLLVERVTKSAHTAGVATMLYMFSPPFFAFNAQFSYQTLAIGLGAATIAICVAGRDTAIWNRRAALAILGVCCLVITHHLTSFLLIVGVGLVGRYAPPRHAGHARAFRSVAAAGLIAGGIWLMVVGPGLATYLADIFRTGAADATRFLTSNGTRVETPRPHVYSPALELASAAGAVLLWLLLVIAGLWTTIRDRAPLPRSRQVPAAVLAAAYPAVVFGWYSRGTTLSEIAMRASTFVFLGMAFSVAVWFTMKTRKLRAVQLAVVTVLLTGGIVLGFSPTWQRLPGPYIVGADQRAIDAKTMDAVRWARRNLPEGARISADRVTGATFAAFAHSAPVTRLSGGVNVSPLYTSNAFSSAQKDVIRDGRISFVVVDLRLVRDLPAFGTYFEPTGETLRRLTSHELAKFERVPALRKLYDNGSIRIYDARGLLPARARAIDAAQAAAPHGNALLALIWVYLLAMLARFRFRCPDVASALASCIAVTAVLMALALVAVLTPLPGEIVVPAGSFVLLMTVAARRPSQRSRLAIRARDAITLLVAAGIVGASTVVSLRSAQDDLALHRTRGGAVESNVLVGDVRP